MNFKALACLEVLRSSRSCVLRMFFVFEGFCVCSCVLRMFFVFEGFCVEVLRDFWLESDESLIDQGSSFVLQRLLEKFWQSFDAWRIDPK